MSQPVRLFLALIAGLSLAAIVIGAWVVAARMVIG